jgi:phosphatidylinositol-3-phosphatase
MRLRDFRHGWRHGTLSVVTVALAATGLAGIDLAVDVGTAHASTITVNASEDSYIDSSNPGTNFGTAVWLTADNNPKKYGYYKFNVTIPAGETITNVNFQCWAGSNNSKGLGLWTTSSTWSESTVTWNNAPMANFGLPPSGTTGAVTANTYNIANVTSAITGSGTFTLVGSTASNTGWSCASKENSNGHPTQLVITTSTGGGSGLCGFMPTGTTSKFMVIWEENRNYTDVVGNSAAPYLNNTVKPQCGLATNYNDLGHPSLPNYMSATSGLAFNFSPWTNDCSPGGSCLSSADNIYHQQETKGTTWRGYAEAMTSNCQATNSGTYAVRHNPPPYYTDLANCGSWDIPAGTTTSGNLHNDVVNGTLPAYSSVTPDNCNNGHDCSTQTADSWLAGWVPVITAGPDYQQGRLALIIVWDEGSGADHVACFVLSAHTTAGVTVGTAFNHYSMLRTAEEITGVPLLANAASAASMRSGFGL